MAQEVGSMITYCQTCKKDIEITHTDKYINNTCSNCTREVPVLILVNSLLKEIEELRSSMNSLKLKHEIVSTNYTNYDRTMIAKSLNTTLSIDKEIISEDEVEFLVEEY
jgi:hypothetical protein